jgi:cap1 methyltransferase
MAAMDAACGWIFSYADAEEPAREGGASSNPPDAPFGTAPRPAPSLLHFGDVAAGPGGFSEYLLWRRGGSACGVGFTLRGDHDFTLQRFHYKAVPELFHPYYGPKDDGDLYQSTNLRALQALVGRQTAGAGLHVVMADGGFDVSGAENIQEVLNKQLLLTQFAAALGCLAEGGHFVCKAFDLFTPFSAGLLYVMYRCFDAVCVYKPAASRPANSERYIICKGLRRANPPAFEYLLTVNDRLNVLKRAWRSSGQKEGDGGQDVTALAPGALLGLGTPFGSYLTESNNRLGRLQAKALRRLVAMLRNPGERCGDQTATREACLTAWRLPADAPPVIEHPDIETFYLREVGADDMPRAVEAQPLRGRDLDPESVTAKLRRAEDWVCLESSAEKPVLMLGADGEGRRGLVFTWDAIHSTWQLRQEAVLPRGTLLLVEMVAEQTAQGGFQACCPLPAAHCPLPTAHCLLPTTHCTLLAACCLLPAACCLLPAACCLLPAAHYLLWAHLTRSARTSSTQPAWRVRTCAGSHSRSGAAAWRCFCRGCRRTPRALLSRGAAGCGGCRCASNLCGPG